MEASRVAVPRKLLLELYEWLDDHTDGAPDAPAWTKQAGYFAEELHPYVK